MLGELFRLHDRVRQAISRNEAAAERVRGRMPDAAVHPVGGNGKRSRGVGPPPVDPSETRWLSWNGRRWERQSATRGEE